MPSAKKFLQRSMLLASRPRSFRAACVSLVELDGEKAVAVEGMILERIRGHLRFAQVALGKVVAIDDQDAVGLQVLDVHFQRGGVHGDQHVHRSPGV